MNPWINVDQLKRKQSKKDSGIITMVSLSICFALSIGTGIAKIWVGL